MTTQEMPKVLCVDDEPSILDSLQRTLRRRFEVIIALNAHHAKEIIKDNSDLSVIISDHRLGADLGVELLSHAQKVLPSASRVLLSGQMDLKSIEEAINSAKIHKFILKPWENDELLLHVIEAYKIHKEILEKERLQRLSITDPITQLTNHRFFQEKIRIEWDKSKKKDLPLSLIMIDVDHFKKFNDRFGHPEGDKFLAAIAATLKMATPPEGSLSRYGGEEFSLILPEMTSAKALEVAEKLRNEILQTNFNNYPLSISLGVATSPQHASSVDELILSADQSLYQAKRRGRNQTVVGLSFTP